MDGPKTILVALGNPLLDMVVPVEDRSLLDRFGLPENGAVLVREGNAGRLMPIFDELSRLPAGQEHLPGGSTLNTVRVFQWMLTALTTDNNKQPLRAAFFGAVGLDPVAEMLAAKLAQEGVDVRLQRIQGQETGKCATLVHGHNRSMCSSLGAAEHFSAAHLELPQHRALIESAEYFYVGGFFLSVSVPSVMRLARHAAERGKLFAFNLSSTYIPVDFKEALNAVLPFVDFLFGNDDEALVYAEANGLDVGGDVRQIALKLAQMDRADRMGGPSRSGGDGNRVVLITRGERPLIVAQRNGLVREVPAPALPHDRIVDTDGAGDAFCGGFLAALACARPLDECIRCALFAAATIVQHRGCTFPPECAYTPQPQ